MNAGPSAFNDEEQPRIPATIAIVLGIAAGLVAIVSMVLAFSDRTFVMVALSAAVVAVISFLFGRYAFRLVHATSRERPHVGPMLLLVSLAFLLGVLGSIGILLYSSAVGSGKGVVAAILLLVLSSAVTMTGARLVGLGVVRSRGTEDA